MGVLCWSLFGMHYFMSILAIILTRERERELVALFLLSFGCFVTVKCSVTLSCSAVG